MAETTLEKAVCLSCGADVRDDTTFCYNCGKPLERASTTIAEASRNGTTEEVPIEKPDTDLSKELERMRVEEETNSRDRLAMAAAKRKRARTSQRKPRQMVWVSAEESSNIVYILVTIVITATAAGVVLLTLYWK